MKKTIKYFITSDEHGCFEEMKIAEELAGYQEENPLHYRVSLGDFMDRGEQTKEIYEYYKRLSDEGKATILGGNHSLFLIGFLEGDNQSFSFLRNGLNETIYSFLEKDGETYERWCLLKGEKMETESFLRWSSYARKIINDKFPELLPWLKSLPRYFETKMYIGVHGAIDTRVPDWRHPHCCRGGLIDWDALDFNDGSFFGESIVNTDKTVIIGHFGTDALRKLYKISDGGDSYRILEREDGRVIAIDGTVNYKRKMNLLIIEDEEL